MPVYEVRFLVQAETSEAAREAIRVPNTPHTEPILSQWGYFSQIEDDTQDIFLRNIFLKTLSPGQNWQLSRTRQSSSNNALGQVEDQGMGKDPGASAESTGGTLECVSEDSVGSPRPRKPRKDKGTSKRTKTKQVEND